MDFASDYPCLMEFLWREKWPDDGAPRRPGTLTVFQEEGRWKACVNDRDQQLVAFVSDDAFAGLLRTIEDGLDKDALDWRRAGGTGNSRKRS